ncbi:MAG TPA: M1 family metallopeptidase [Candidatus Binatia bacterium]|nr:M1 family metallopeptidase [Candidatus Binatia bacterium]
MKARSVIILLPLLSVIAISVLVKEHAARAAAPQAAPAPATAAPAATPGSAATIPNTLIAVNSDKPMSERIVHYEIDAHYDAVKHVVDATEILTYHNVTGQALDHFPFHLYQNAFQPKATWVTEAKLMGSRDQSYAKWEDKDYSSEEIKSLEVVGQGDLTAKLHYISPDDGNKDDKTVIDLPVNKPVPSGEYVQFKIAFQTKFPEAQARSGYTKDFVLGGQWFPKVGVFWHGAWNCHQYHNTTEFFADFGVYDVKLTLPQNEIVGASGVRTGETRNSDGTQTLTYHGDDIHDFAWTASPRYRVQEAVYQGQMGPVNMRLLMQPEHWNQADRHEKILRQSLEHFERWYGPYPYKTITLVDPVAGSPAEGMEYPTFITGGTAWWVPKGEHEVEIVVEHEFGHQYWYGMVATNEFEDAWMDEGINSYTEVKVMDDVLGRDKSVLDFAGITAGEREAQRMFFTSVDDLDPMAKNAYDYYNSNSYGGITYGKTASVLLTLESVIGEDTMQKAMHAYFMKYRFTHPSKEDFLKTIEEVSGQNLRWYFNQAVYGTQVMDYKVLRTESLPVNWYEEKKDKSDEKNTVYRSYVWLQRKGEFVMPADVEIKFDNGDKLREHWDGVDRWARFGPYEKKAKIVSAELDPDHRIQIDHNNFDNSYVDEANKAPARKVTNYWTFATQWLAQALAWWGV